MTNGSVTGAENRIGNLLCSSVSARATVGGSGANGLGVVPHSSLISMYSNSLLMVSTSFRRSTRKVSWHRIG